MNGWSRSAQDGATLALIEAAKTAAVNGDEKAAIRDLTGARAAIANDQELLPLLAAAARAVQPALRDPSCRTACERLLAAIARDLGEAAPRQSRTFREGIPVSTANEIPGWVIIDYVGEVVGVVVRSRGYFPQIGAKLQSVVGGELDAMTKLLHETRIVAIDRLVDEALARGGNAVIAMRLDVSEMAGVWTEVCAYGTAVLASRADTT